MNTFQKGGMLGLEESTKMVESIMNFEDAKAEQTKKATQIETLTSDIREGKTLLTKDETQTIKSLNSVKTILFKAESLEGVTTKEGLEAKKINT